MPGLGSVDLLVRRFFSIRQAAGGRWLDDGCIGYLSDVTGMMQLWRYCPGRGHDLLLPWERRVGGFRVSGSGLVSFMSDFDGDENWAIYVYDGSRVDLAAGEDGKPYYLGSWGPGGALAFTGTGRNGVDFDLYVYEPGKGSRLAVELEGMNSVADWLDDRRVILVHRNTNMDSDIYIVDIVDGGIVNITGHEGEALNVSPRRLDDSRIVYASNQSGEFLSLYMYDLGSGERRLLADHGWDVEIVEVDGDGTVYYVVNEDGESVLYKWVEGIGSRLVWKAPGTILSLNPRGGRLLVTLSSPLFGVEVFLLREGVAERVTRSPKAGLDEDSFVYPERFEYESFDGLKVRGLFYRPRRPASTPPPAIVWLHGGPESQERARWNMFIQLAVSLGYAVVAPNFRGSWGYGKTFVHLDDVEKREGAVHDVYYAVKYLADKGLIDPERLCVMGGSYGGYLTLMSIAYYPEVWRCAVEIVGIVNLVTFIRNTSAYRRKYRITEYGDPDKHYEVMMRLSPITHIDKIRAPLMVIHGAKDPRVPVSEAEQLVEALRGRGVPVRYIRLEDEGHGIAKIENRLRVYTEAAKFIIEHLSGPGREA